MAKLEMPSKVMHEKFIRMPKGIVVESDEEWGRCGKWIILHPHSDLKFMDSAWSSLQQLLADGTLLMLKASTAKMAKVGATIHCFTRPGKREAMRAARAIRKVVNFFGIMFYKLNEQTSQGIANRYGDKRVCMYMHTFLGVFYTKKINDGAWVQDIEEGAENISIIASEFFKENYSGNGNLLSTLEGGMWCLSSPENHQCERNGCSVWYLFCSCEEEGPYLSDADRVWLLAKRLVEEGSFVGATIKKQAGAKHVEVRLYVSEHCDVYSRLAACDRIFKEASFRTIMYFIDAGKRIPDRRGLPLNDFEYTSSGELYRLTNHCHEYVFI